MLKLASAWPVTVNSAAVLVPAVKTTSPVGEAAPAVVNTTVPPVPAANSPKLRFWASTIAMGCTTVAVVVAVSLAAAANRFTAESVPRTTAEVIAALQNAFLGKIDGFMVNLR